MANEYTTITIDLTGQGGTGVDGTLYAELYQTVTLANNDTVPPRKYSATVTTGAGSIVLPCTATAIKGTNAPFKVTFIPTGGAEVTLGRIIPTESASAVQLSDLLEVGAASAVPVTSYNVDNTTLVIAPSIAALAAMRGLTDGDRVLVQDIGIYRYAAASTATANDVGIVSAQNGVGRWLLEVQSGSRIGMYNVLDYGARSTGLEADAATNKAALDAAIAAAYAAGYGTVLIPPGTYYTNAVIYLQPGITILGYGATLKLPASQADFSRILTTQASTWSSATDSPLLTIKGLTLDGNRANQGTYTGSELEHNAGIFLTCGSTSTKGRLRTHIEDCTFLESTGDGLGTYINTDTKVVNCHAYNCFRGGITITGGWSRFQVDGFTSDGDANYLGFQVEIANGAGYSATGQGRRLDLVASNMDVGGFDVAFNGSDANQGGTMMFTNVRSTQAICSIDGQQGSMRFVNCDFLVGSVGAGTSNRLNRPTAMTFVNCVFRMDPAGTSDTRLANINWNPSGGTATGQRLRYVGCRFLYNASATGSTYGVYSVNDNPTNDNIVMIENCDFDGAFTAAIIVDRGKAHIANTLIKGAGRGVHVTGGASSVPYLVTLDDVRWSGCTNTIYFGATNAVNVLTFKNIVIESADATMTVASAFADTKYGNRVILTGTDPTTTSTPGLAGDIRQLTSPVTGGAFRWIATTSSLSAATWRVLEAVPIIATAVWNPGNLVDGAGETSAAITATGAAFGDEVIVTAPYDLQAITLTAWVSAADTVKARLQNETGGAIDLASGTWTWRVIKR